MDEEQEREKVGELLQELDPQRGLLWRSQLVLAILVPVQHDLVRGEADVLGGVVKLANTLDFPRVLGELDVGGKLVLRLRLLALVPRERFVGPHVAPSLPLIEAAQKATRAT